MPNTSKEELLLLLLLLLELPLEELEELDLEELDFDELDFEELEELLWTLPASAKDGISTKSAKETITANIIVTILDMCFFKISPPLFSIKKHHN